jgi:beta-N-acetylhexosaminidase
MSDDVSMGALSGSISERAAAAIAAGCDMVLHCNGELAEMRDVAAAVPELAGAAARRAAAALAQKRKPAPVDLVASRAEFARLMAGVWQPVRGVA